MAEYFRFRNGARVKIKDAGLASRELSRIRKKFGGGALDPRTVWEESRGKAAALHGEFTWDNSKAADLWRDEEARNLIQAIVIVNEDETSGARAWPHVIFEDRSGYMPISVVVKDSGLREQVITEIQRDLISTQVRLQKFREYAKEAKAIGKVVERLSK